mmetsp:Transcript_11335/g.22747  ORF Transcript_11335/g.22747 Transcript_11335/m.22747 type:complete len:242 (-) Transcript_11335:664-1389(-)
MTTTMAAAMLLVTTRVQPTLVPKALHLFHCRLLLLLFLAPASSLPLPPSISLLPSSPTAPSEWQLHPLHRPHHHQHHQHCHHQWCCRQQHQTHHHQQNCRPWCRRQRWQKKLHAFGRNLVVLTSAPFLLRTFLRFPSLLFSSFYSSFSCSLLFSPRPRRWCLRHLSKPSRQLRPRSWTGTTLLLLHSTKRPLRTGAKTSWTLLSSFRRQYLLFHLRHRHRRCRRCQKRKSQSKGRRHRRQG